MKINVINENNSPIHSDLDITLLLTQTSDLIRSVSSDPSKFKIQETFAAGKRKDMFKSTKEAHEKADNTSVKTLVIPSCVFGALSPSFLVLPLYPPPTPSSLCSV